MLRKSVSLSSFELTESTPEWFKWIIHLEKGYEPEVRFEMEPRQLSVSFRMLLNKADEFPEFQPFANMKKGNEKVLKDGTVL